MTDSGPDSRLKEVIAMLRAQNRRYRELIQNLSSTNDVLRARLKEAQPRAPELRAFETFGQGQGPTVELATGSPGKKETIRSTGQKTEHKPRVELKSLVPVPGWKCLAADQPQIRIGFLLFRMTPENIQEAVEAVELRQVRSRDFTPVFITDNPDLAPFRNRGYVVEYVSASITSSKKKNRAHQHYLETRLELIRAKWGLGSLVDLGSNPQTGEM